MGQAQINVRTRACSRTSIARTKQAALTHNVRGKELIYREAFVFYVTVETIIFNDLVSQISKKCECATRHVL